MGDNWELPKPVFRSSSGSLPQDFPARVGADAPPPAEAKAPDEGDQILSTLYAPPEEVVEDPVVAEPQQTATPIDDIEPQPFISEQFTVDDVAPTVAEKAAKKGGSGSAFLMVGIALILAMILGVLAIVYFLFFRSPPDATF